MSHIAKTLWAIDQKSEALRILMEKLAQEQGWKSACQKVLVGGKLKKRKTKIVLRETIDRGAFVQAGLRGVAITGSHGIGGVPCIGSDVDVIVIVAAGAIHNRIRGMFSHDFPWRLDCTVFEDPFDGPLPLKAICKLRRADFVKMRSCSGIDYSILVRNADIISKRDLVKLLVDDGFFSAEMTRDTPISRDIKRGSGGIIDAQRLRIFIEAFCSFDRFSSSWLRVAGNYETFIGIVRSYASTLIEMPLCAFEALEGILCRSPVSFENVMELRAEYLSWRRQLSIEMVSVYLEKRSREANEFPIDIYM